MRFKPELPEAVLTAEELERDYSQAENLDGIQLGERCLYFRKFSGVTYLPYDRIDRAWLRQEEVKARMCCCTANFDQFYLVVSYGDGRERRGHVAGKAEGRQCLDRIEARNPDVEIGYVKPAE